MLDKLLTPEIISPILIIIGAFVTYRILKRVILKFFKTKKTNKKNKTIISIAINILRYFIMVVALLMILDVYGIDTASIIASLGVLGLVLGLAVQDILKDWIAGMFIIIENQYSIGDNVTIGDFRGEVTELGVKTTKLRAYTGEVKIISNRNILEVINHSIEDSLAIVDFGVAYNTDVKKLEKVINKLIIDLKEEHPTIVGDINFLGLDNLGDSSLTYRITAVTKAMEHFAIQRIIKQELVLRLAKNNIEIPFNQVVIHNA